ncbi:MAG: apolipoprotein N-acyltransferase [Ruminococcaceae bacterium]|nr:apolipoprotein N-acyltransferase [Oscillospiraceae bacterium]
MKEFFIKNKWLLFALLGLINATSFIHNALFFISWFSLSPFMILIEKESRENTSKRLFFHVFSFYFTFYFVVYNFFIALYPMDFVGLGHLSCAIVLLLGWLILSVFHSAFVAFFTFLALKVKINRFCKFLAIGFVFIAVQYIQSLGKYGFTWARFSFPQVFFLPTIQSASLFGPYFIDLILVLFNVLVAMTYITKKKIYPFIAIIIFVLNLTFGLVNMTSTVTTSRERDVVIVQGNVLENEKWRTRSSFSVYMTESEKVKNSNSLVIWPETAIPTYLNTSNLALSKLENYSLETDSDMIVGAFYLGNTGREYNGAYYIEDGKVTNDVYFKRRLVPFGEFLPMRKVLSAFDFLDAINLFSSDLTPGTDTNIMTTKYGKIGTLICFDTIFSSLARESAKDGAELLVAITNDSWYKDFPAVYQHNSHSKWRAVENGRWVVRAANSGISSVINPHGEMISSLPPLTKGTLKEKVYFISDTTLYTKIGDVILIPVFLYLIFYFFPIKKAFAKRQKH